MEHAHESEPRMLRHRRWNRAFMVVRDPDGKRRQVTLGAWGSPEAQRCYQIELAKWYARQRRGEAEAEVVATEPDASLTVAGAAGRWMLHCEAYYRHADGTPTSEVANCREAVRPLLDLFGDQAASAFSSKKLHAVRDRMIHGDPRKPAGKRRIWCRTLANQAVGRIRRMFKWLAAEEFVPAGVHASLCTLAPLKRGRTDARETKPTRPVSDADVAATLLHLPPTVADMVRVQHLVGMRPGELVAMTTGELDRSESTKPGCWIFRPSQSKLSYRGRIVEYPIGPQAVAILTRYLRADPQAPLFSPSDSERQRSVEMRARRRTKVQPSQMNRRIANPQRKAGDRYDTMAYGHAVRRAAKRAGVPTWSPHALRRAVATRLRAMFGAEIARVMLAHQSLDMTALYAHRDLTAALEIAAKIG